MKVDLLWDLSYQFTFMILLPSFASYGFVEKGSKLISIYCVHVLWQPCLRWNKDKFLPNADATAPHDSSSELYKEI